MTYYIFIGYDRIFHNCEMGSLYTFFLFTWISNWSLCKKGFSRLRGGCLGYINNFISVTTTCYIWCNLKYSACIGIENWIHLFDVYMCSNKMYIWSLAITLNLYVNALRMKWLKIHKSLINIIACWELFSKIIKTLKKKHKSFRIMCTVENAFPSTQTRVLLMENNVI